ncbi:MULTISPECIES: CBS domain-containing protein [Arsenicicoccus]|jgi:CBS domain-containing protein|uniref:CBS domain-containing protein n=1 Tax=Arsenicicoccus bolidensis TaxID=229480 RepID=A0ABS9PXU6_9MICO|nr:MULTISPECIES: CBS domain-containing protein [Arsenicicoccus]MCG7320449.1 CBS domain-containing protein [Arsenicicoccus bolidensis]
MKISDVVKSKGSDVVTMRPDATVGELLTLLADHNIGAVVVSDDGTSVSGIVSERDVVRHLGRSGAGVLQEPVSTIMTVEVHTCSFGDEIEDLAGSMTERRIRHVPVIEDGRLAAIVTIGDVVKHRISQLQDERDHLVGYINQ